MKPQRSKIIQWKNTPSTGQPLSRVGQIVQITDRGIPIVDFAENPNGPVAARSIVTESTPRAPARLCGAKVLLNFENGNPSLPIIVGFVHQTLFPEPSPGALKAIQSPPQEIVVDGETVRLEGQQEIILRCGDASIMLNKDGKVVIKGVEVVNRATQTNTIKGGVVRIN